MVKKLGLIVFVFGFNRNRTTSYGGILFESACVSKSIYYFILRTIVTRFSWNCQ